MARVIPWAVALGLAVTGCAPVTLAPDAPVTDGAGGAAPPLTGPDLALDGDGAVDAAVDPGVDGEVDAMPCDVEPTVAELAPMTPLVLAGPPGEAIARWVWQVHTQPEGANAVLAEYFEGGAARPDFEQTPEITFLADRVGRYELGLLMVGQDGEVVCAPPPTVAIDVRPGAGLYAQLTWTTPFDTCDDCDPGVDLDLVMAPRDQACWGSGSSVTARPGDARDWPPEDSAAGDPGGVAITDDAAGLEAMGIPAPPGLMAWSLAVLAYDLTVDTGVPGPPAEWSADAVLSLYWDGAWIGEYETRLTSTGQVHHLVDVFSCSGVGCRPDVSVVGRSSVWGTCAE